MVTREGTDNDQRQYDINNKLTYRRLTHRHGNLWRRVDDERQHADLYEDVEQLVPVGGQDEVGGCVQHHLVCHRLLHVRGQHQLQLYKAGLTDTDDIHVQAEVVLDHTLR